MKRRLLIALTMGAASALLLSGCGVANVITPPYAAAIYATPADAAGASASVALPVWVPADASYIRIKTDETKNASIMMFGVPQAAGVIGVQCSDTAADPDAVQGTSASLDETWWPQTIPPAEQIYCYGAWHLFWVGTQYYAWTP